MSSGRGAVGAAVMALSLAGSCRSSGPAFDSVPELPTEPRRPAGTDVELHVTYPEGVRTSDTQEGLVLLEAPADPARARAVVAAFFRALVEESPSALETVLAPQAMIQSASRREPARAHFQGRFARTDFHALAGEALFRDEDMELVEPRRAGGLAAMFESSPDSLVARVRVVTSSSGRQRLLGDEFAFRLIPSAGGFAISEIVEEFRGPP